MFLKTAIFLNSFVLGLIKNTSTRNVYVISIVTNFIQSECQIVLGA